MKLNGSKTPGVAELSTFRRTSVRVSQEEMVRAAPIHPDSPLPLLVEPAAGEVELAGWARSNHAFIERNLAAHGALIFRNFNVRGARQFGQFIESASGRPMEYRERSSPRSQVEDRIYTSTDHPPEQSIFLHNEHSYSKTFPLRLFFCCLRPAEQGGETPLADTRKVLQRIDPRIRERFVEKGWMYVRNFGDGFGLPWQAVFQTSDKALVEEYCRRTGVEVEWKSGGRLRTRQVRPVIAKHPLTGEAVWFNHLTFFHISTLEPQVRAALQAEFGEEDLPNNTYYGDGSPVEPSVMDELRAAYVQETVTFQWRAGDIVLLDNMTTSHGRNPYAGQRQVLFAMAEPHTRTDV